MRKLVVRGVATKDFRTASNILRVNKFGVHKLVNSGGFDTGLGCSYDFWQHEKSFGHAEFCEQKVGKQKVGKQKVGKQKVDKQLHAKIIDYIKKSRILENALKKVATLSVVIENHAWPIIQLHKDSNIVVDGVSKWDGSSMTMPIKRPKIRSDWQKEIANNFKLSSVKHILPTIQLPNNGYCFVFDRYDIFTNQGLKFCEQSDVNNTFAQHIDDINNIFPNTSVANDIEKSHRERFTFREYAPGGKDNLGTLLDGKKFERWIKPGENYKLKITISPGIKKTNANQRSVQANYPFLKNNNPDANVWVMAPKPGMTAKEMIENEMWNFEHYFGINFE